MEVPTFPSPPSPLESTSTRPTSSVEKGLPHIGTSVTGRLRHVSPGKHARSNGSIPILLNSLSKRRVHRLARLGNTVHPRDITKELSSSIKTKHKRTRVTEFRVRMTERREDEEDDGEVVCASGKNQ